jgi:hypothetical protein
MSQGTYGTNDWLRSDDHKYYTQEDSVSEVTIYKNIPDSRTSDLIFSQLYVSCEALPIGIHRLELSCLSHLLVLLPHRYPLKRRLCHHLRICKDTYECFILTYITTYAVEIAVPMPTQKYFLFLSGFVLRAETLQLPCSHASVSE